MSQYISSFLIEPVVRQARRFSRPADDSPPFRPPRSPPDDGTATQQGEPVASDVDTVEDFPSLDLDRGQLQQDAGSGNEDLHPATAIHELGDGESQDHGSDQVGLTLASPQVDRAMNTELGRNAPNHYSEAIDADRNSIHPPNSARDRLVSDTSSLNNSGPPIVDPTMSPADYVAMSDTSQTSRDRGESGGSQSLDGTLPADDGMSDMRQRIIAIQRTDSSSEEKARLVHGLMTERHNASQSSLLAPNVQFSGSVHSSDRPFTPMSPESMNSLEKPMSPPTSSASSTDPANPFNLSSADFKPTYWKDPQQLVKDSEHDETSSQSEDDSKALGCDHYKRNIKLQCSACYRWYTCRFCHDEVEDHMLNRRETKNMLCMLCGRPQPASGECAQCGHHAAWYYCDICKLWDDSPDKRIYHCSECGICRIGEGLGKDFFHCKVIHSQLAFGFY